MTTLRRFTIVAALAALAFGLVPALAGAGNPEQLAKTRDKIKAAKREKATLGQQIATLDGRLAAIDKRLEGLGDQIESVEQKLATTREKLEVLQEQLRLKRLELQKAQAKLSLEQVNFGYRLTVAYKSSDLTYLDVVLASSSFEDLVSRVGVVHDLVAGNDQLVGEYRAARDEVDREKDAIAEKESGVRKVVADLDEQNEQLAALRAAQAAQQAAALAARKKKSGALSAVKDDLALLERQEDQLLAESDSLTGFINGSPGGGGGTGRLMWPVRGSVVSPFGYRIHPILGYRKLHTGIDIAVGYGVPIHAADGGTVIYATWMGGYGNVIIIDHGGGLSTLYAHQSSLAVGNGARVSKGRVIGRVGSTGFSTGPHLHFEVRRGGSPVNPMAYLP